MNQLELLHQAKPFFDKVAYRKTLEDACILYYMQYLITNIYYLLRASRESILDEYIP
jgi:hypothetical protein